MLLIIEAGKRCRFLAFENAGCPTKKAVRKKIPNGF
jgi:hypothetical protein